MDTLTSTQPNNRPVHLFFSKLVDLAKSETFIKISPTLEREVVVCTSWNELSEKLKLKPSSICIGHEELVNASAVDVVNMISTLGKLVGLSDIPISVSVTKCTPYSLVKELQKSGIVGILPYYRDFGLDETMKSLDAVWNGIPYWPKHIMDQLPGAKPQKPIGTQLPEIKLTARQKQIVNLVTERGASNKIIARTLNISESTVKLHLGNIFKKYGVKNRTQLAVFAKL